MSQTIAADPTAGALDLEDLRGFVFERVLMESTLSGSTYLLGKIHDEPAILLIQRTQIAGDAAPGIVQGGLASLNVFLENKPYFSAHADLLPSAMSDLKITAIWPAGPEHIRKYAAQEHVMFNETKEVYDKVVLPYIESIPAGRISWVYNILAGEKEAERVLFREEDTEQGFVLLPDLKWDQTSMNAMYLTAITQSRSLRSMRDLTRAHLPLLRNIKAKVEETVLSKYGVDKGKLRMFVHYQPTYYHFHVHIVHIAHEGFAGMWVGKAHLLDDLISLLELSPEDPAESILRKMTLTYALGTNHPLCSLLHAHLSPSSDPSTAQSVEASAAAIGQ